MILVCGEALFDMFLEGVPPADCRILNFQAHVGGSPLNVATGLARLGGSAGLMTGLSTDFLGAQLLSVLESESISTKYAVRSSRPTTVSFVALAADGSAQYLFLGEGSADRSILPDQLPTDMTEISALHFGSYSLITPTTGDSFVKLIKRESGRRFISIDPNVRTNVQPDLDCWRQNLSECAALVDLIKLSDEDCELLYPGESDDQIAEYLRSIGAGMIVVTRGASGSSAWNDGGKTSVSAPQISVVDTVGAGDSFQAALLSRLHQIDALNPGVPKNLTGDQVQQILAFSTTAAAITCSRRGADLPHLSEVMSAMDESADYSPADDANEIADSGAIAR